MCPLTLLVVVVRVPPICRHLPPQLLLSVSRHSMLCFVKSRLPSSNIRTLVRYLRIISVQLVRRKASLLPFMHTTNPRTLASESELKATDNDRLAVTSSRLQRTMVLAPSPRGWLMVTLPFRVVVVSGRYPRSRGCIGPESARTVCSSLEAVSAASDG